MKGTTTEWQENKRTMAAILKGNQTRKTRERNILPMQNSLNKSIEYNTQIFQWHTHSHIESFFVRFYFIFFFLLKCNKKQWVFIQCKCSYIISELVTDIRFSTHAIPYRCVVTTTKTSDLKWVTVNDTGYLSCTFL